MRPCFYPKDRRTKQKSSVGWLLSNLPKLFHQFGHFRIIKENRVADGQTARRTDTPSFDDARTHLKGILAKNTFSLTPSNIKLQLHQSVFEPKTA